MKILCITERSDPHVIERVIASAGVECSATIVNSLETLKALESKIGTFDAILVEEMKDGDAVSSGMMGYLVSLGIRKSNKPVIANSGSRDLNRYLLQNGCNRVTPQKDAFQFLPWNRRRRW